MRLAKSGVPAAKEFEALRERVALFSLAGHFVDATTREAHLRYYGLCQKGQRVQETLRSLRSTIQAINQAHVAEEQSSQLRSLNDTQEKVEWIELFIISFYGAELAKTVSEMFRFEHVYAQWSVIGTALVALGFAYLLLGLGKHGKRREEVKSGKPGLSSRVKWWLVVGVFAAWFGTGFLGFRSEGHASGGTGDKGVERREEDEAIARILEKKPARAGVKMEALREGLWDEWTRALRARANGEKVGERDAYERAAQIAGGLEQLKKEGDAAEAAQAAFLAACPAKCQTLGRVRAAAEEGRQLEGAEEFGRAIEAWTKARRLAEGSAKK